MSNQEWHRQRSIYLKVAEGFEQILLEEIKQQETRRLEAKSKSLLTKCKRKLMQIFKKTVK